MFFGFLQRSRSARVAKKNWISQGLQSFELFHTGSSPRRSRENGKKKRGFWPWSRGDDDEDKFEIKRVQICDEAEPPILAPQCKVAIIVGGPADSGLCAADCLLHHGARAVVLVNENAQVGEKAAQSLCDFYGKNRARFYQCSVGSSCQLSGIFETTLCRYRRVDVLISNLDGYDNTARSPCEDTEDTCSNTMRVLITGMQYLGKPNGGSGGIIINGASILGFMGWPADPTPVYCFKEPVVESTIDYAKIHPVAKTGVRIVSLLKSNKYFAQIGLPDFPKFNKHHDLESSQCYETSSESRFGQAVVHLMARAQHGTTWFCEPAPALREIPWQIYFPTDKEETIDAAIYNQQVSH